MLIAVEMKSDKCLILIGTYKKIFTVTKLLPWKFLMISVWVECHANQISSGMTELVQYFRFHVAV